MTQGARFVDTGYWLALSNSSDPLNARARTLAETLHGPLMTTQAVLLEVGNVLARRRWRPLAIALLARISSAPDLEIVPLDPELFARALELYTARPDKEWGLTDCVSFVVMRDRGIQEALASDRHFVQAGFRALLADEGP